MKYQTILLSISLISSGLLYADGNVKYGIGVGTLYGGYGVNVAYTSNKEMAYLSYGCKEIEGDKSNNACGAGVGYLSTSILEDLSNEHAIGFYLGYVGNYRIFNSYLGTYDEGNIHGGSISYHYFPNSIGKSGLNYGFGFAYGTENGIDLKQYWLNLGYQF